MGTKVVMITGLGVAALSSAAVLIARFDQDPTGGVRPELMRIATRALPDNLSHGVGPNSYVTEIASHSGSFIPVHNTFVLAILELGLVGALLLFGPPALLVLKSLARFKSNDYARAVVAVAPGIVVVGWTGWGMLGTSIFPLWFFAFGFLAMGLEKTFREEDASDRSPEDREADHESQGHAAVRG